MEKELTIDYWFTNDWNESDFGGEFFKDFVYHIYGCNDGWDGPESPRPGVKGFRFSFAAYDGEGGMPGWTKETREYGGEADWYCILEQHLAEEVFMKERPEIKYKAVVL